MPAAVRAVGRAHRRELRTVAVHGAVHGRRRRVSLRAGVTDNPVRLTRSVKDALTHVTCGGAPAYVWPGGGITVMVDVMRMPENAFGYVPTPAIVAPIEFTHAAAGLWRTGWPSGSCAAGAERADPGDSQGGTRRGRGRSERQPDLSLGQVLRGARLMGAVAALLPGGDRLHLQHGPIDLILGADGARAAAFRAAERRFGTVLEELVAELPLLRQAVGIRPEGAVARRMHAAVRPQGEAVFVTPMAAVAGAVAEEILAAMLAAAALTRAYVNNGGDIALHLGAGTRYRLAVASPANHALGVVEIAAGDPVRGVATSGQGGRSLSFGIADAVTVLAASAALADVAATLIANAVDLPGHPVDPARPGPQPSARQRSGRAAGGDGGRPPERGRDRGGAGPGRRCGRRDDCGGPRGVGGAVSERSVPDVGADRASDRT